ncbi:pleckstrin homology domain-containing family S member 1-like [Rhinophrynus dorsalis]
MAPPNRRTSSVDLDVIKKGCLIKSPPSYIINNQKSWKRRLFKLCKSTENIYTFRYYSYGIKEEFKREIFISDVHDIKHGSQLKEEELELPFRVCGCTSAHNILFIKTKKRDFFLFDENK